MASRPAWGYGCASEAARAALRFGFDGQRLKEIVAITVPANIRSQQVMRRLEMTYSFVDDFDHPRPAGRPSNAAMRSLSPVTLGLVAPITA